MKRDKCVDEWVEKAEGDFETILDLRSKRRPKQRCIIAFHCQQCVEKYLKALLTFHKIHFSKHHDLEELLVLLLGTDSLLAPMRKQLKELTPYAVEFRYPGDVVISEEVTEAVKYAKHLRLIFRKRLGLRT
ncbi:DNA-binding protein [Candidatus Saganbacteria bacterium CG08_land_8_20_14_0_20_45_16]|uniref:DNA-binding protein n=1 Tax=Candidatus Saganbacteria bacterium CG08_land_8_20_14_0_20_45_16 TaxID=2014293 RepID=A0A2H0XTT6_UNCSA|nr:MAG: DNA-binding protein [Candidatus Saganbacteria bacterium CG08_land_8_20_14_0_20_45_16]